MQWLQLRRDCDAIATVVRLQGSRARSNRSRVVVVSSELTIRRNIADTYTNYFYRYVTVTVIFIIITAKEVMFSSPFFCSIVF